MILYYLAYCIGINVGQKFLHRTSSDVRCEYLLASISIFHRKQSPWFEGIVDLQKVVPVMSQAHNSDGYQDAPKLG